jgi:hypothetical protein
MQVKGSRRAGSQSANRYRDKSGDTLGQCSGTIRGSAFLIWQRCFSAVTLATIALPRTDELAPYSASLEDNVEDYPSRFQPRSI